MINMKNKSLKRGTTIFFGTFLIFILGIFLLIRTGIQYANGNSSILGIVVSLLLILISLVEMYQSHKMKKEVDISQKTLDLIGDAYYAIYKINLKDGTYNCIKTTSREKEILGDSGSYEHLVKTLKEVSLLDESDNYIARFQHIHENQKSDEPYLCYSGEFQRKIDDQYKWVNVQIIQDREAAPCEALWCFRIVDEEKKNEIERGRAIQDTIESKEKRFKRKN